jgi:hypothetical protein
MAYAKATKKERKIKIEEFCPAPRAEFPAFWGLPSAGKGVW